MHHAGAPYAAPDDRGVDHVVVAFPGHRSRRQDNVRAAQEDRTDLGNSLVNLARGYLGRHDLRGEHRGQEIRAGYELHPPGAP